MSRKQFIEAHGATCRNWRWSWSFINEKEKLVIFGVWDINFDGSKYMLIDEEPELDRAGKRKPAYNEALANIRLVESGEYTLQTFPIFFSDAQRGEHGDGPAAVKSFKPELTQRTLMKVGRKWYAS
jgi:5-methylcytosine-specific restriction enzyme A